MGFWTAGGIALLVIGGIAVLIAAVRSGKPIRCMTGNGIQGLCALGLVDALGTLTGVALGVSWFTAGICTVFGLPGVIMLLLMKLVFVL